MRLVRHTSQFTPTAYQSELVRMGVAKEVSHDDATEVPGQVEVELLVHGDGAPVSRWDVGHQQHLGNYKADTN